MIFFKLRCFGSTDSCDKKWDSRIKRSTYILHREAIKVNKISNELKVNSVNRISENHDVEFKGEAFKFSNIFLMNKPIHNTEKMLLTLLKQK